MTDAVREEDRPAEPVKVRCRRIDGVEHAVKLTVLGPFASPGTRLPMRLVTLDDGPPLVQKWIPRSADGRPADLDPLDREIRAAHRFELVLGPDHPAELPRLQYYNVDDEEPFVLLEPYRGLPVTEVLPSLSAQERYRVQIGLLRALHLAGVAALTHGRVSLDSLRWDARTQRVQLVDFERSARLGGPSAVGGEPADVRDDMWDAGLAVWRTVQPHHVGRVAPDLDEEEAPDALRDLLAGVFVDPAAQRPTPADLLARAREPMQAHAADLGAPLADGRRAFDRLVERKRADRVAQQARQQAAQPRPRWWARWRELVKPPREPVDPAPAPVLVQCPICLDQYPWPDDDELYLYEEEHQKYVVQNVARGSRAALLRTIGYRRCPNPSGAAAAHYLPAMYHAFGPPLVVAMIGRPRAGKTHLLTAMISEILERRALTPYGLDAAPLDLRRHAFFRDEFIRRTVVGGQLAGTESQVQEPREILRVRGHFGERPIAFFDVSGEDLESVSQNDRVARFLLGTNALLFVHGLNPQATPGGNPAFETTLARLRANPGFRFAPAAIAVTKSDRVRYLPPVDRWMRHIRDPLDPLDADVLHAESRDAYAYLSSRGEQAALSPFQAFDRCTLHFTSASGGEVHDERFARGFVPSRTLEPLLALLAMSGMLEGDGALSAGQ